MRALVVFVVGLGAGPVHAADPFVQVSAGVAGGVAACAVRKSGTVACFTFDDPVLRQIPGLVDVVQVAMLESLLGCAVLRSGEVRCFDLDRTRKQKLHPPGLTDAIELVVRDFDVCARRKKGAPVCFHPSEAKPPTPSGYPASTRQIAVGESHGCVLLAKGAVHCWGSNGRGQLGRRARVGMNGLPADMAPAGPSGGVRARVTGATAVAAGEGHSCTIVRNGRVKCWGTHYQGALGVGDHEVKPGTVVTVPGITNAVEIEAYAWTTCVRTRRGEGICWGTNSLGELGDGTLTDRTSPVKLSVGPITDLSLAHGRTCATLANGSVACWGTFARAMPAKVPRLVNVVSLSAGDQGTCARTKDGATWCWGQFGKLVGKAFTALATPTRMAELDGLRQFAVKTDEHDWRACGLTLPFR